VSCIFLISVITFLTKFHELSRHGLMSDLRGTGEGMGLGVTNDQLRHSKLVGCPWTIGPMASH
jgi:hypothetical protein